MAKRQITNLSNFRQSENPCRWLLTMLFMFVLCLMPAIAQAANESRLGMDIKGEVKQEKWYIVNLGDDRAGWMHVQDVMDGENIISVSHMYMTIRRGVIAISLESFSTFTETLDGKPIKAVNIQNFAQMATTTTMTFEDDKITTVSEQNGQTQTRTTLPSKQPWKTPYAQARYIKDELAKGSKIIKTWSIEPSQSAEPFETTMTVQGKEDVEVMGKVVPALVVITTASNMPGINPKAYVNEEGIPVRMTMDMGPMSMTIYEADEQLATAAFSAPQLLAQMLIKPASSIANPRVLRQAVFELKLADQPAGQEPLKLSDSFLPAGAYQRVVWSDSSTARVVIDLDNPVAPGADLPTQKDREASPMLDINDDKIKELATKALANLPADATDQAKALQLRKFVYGFISKKNLAVGFATAGEVARTRQGDCTEHAVLLAALLRTQGIASRTVSGLVYVDGFEGHQNIFGYHMWTRAWLKTADNEKDTGHWTDLDAAIDPQQPFDATHIALGSSNLSPGSTSNDMVVFAPIMGRLSIKPIDVPPAGR